MASANVPLVMRPIMLLLDLIIVVNDFFVMKKM